MADELSERERDLAAKFADNPLDMFQGKTLGWLEDFIRLTITIPPPPDEYEPPTSGADTTGLSAAFYVPGDMKVVMRDLTAETGVYVYEDDSGDWLYCNGVAVSQTTYADLFAYVGANAFGTDSGGNFFLPDCRSRALYFCGTHADTDLGDADGITLASRRPKHQHSLSGSGGTSSDSAGTPAGSVTVAAHSHSESGFTAPATVAGVAGGGTDGFGSSTTGSASPSATFTGSALSGHSHTVTVTGTAGSGMALDAPPYLHIGSLVVRF